ncbi:MAG: CGNR zinc finger domain-containing protein [Actinobacteria bacterium]|nr:CGNR zinc finger domain-containing protein [Actinomycetota bacterium]
MVFAHDTETALAGVAAFVNTASEDPDGLADVAALDAFAETWSWTGRRRRDEEELAELRALRPSLRRLWELDEDDLAAEVNRMLREAGALPQLVAHDGWGYHLHATAPDAPLVDRMAVEAAMAFLDVVRQGELERLRTCDADDCDDVHVDLSRNRSRRFCSPTCANRVHVAAFRSRQADGS